MAFCSSYCHTLLDYTVLSLMGMSDDFITHSFLLPDKCGCLLSQDWITYQRPVGTRLNRSEL
ncbi:hypothetical protein BCR43DRAFT_491559 [Syncephalastrum racemosum]|uniref:Uncharacterized protein n=1 Tax=Syncephalastrum racemosum TaxID=13706 RepID=A0A1X2HC49_SYNRA|nr:hypothetical protein BCR43DRAFT_491559 [Syncephalastrum racemosum]